jgi:hypothetical protein
VLHAVFIQAPSLSSLLLSPPLPRYCYQASCEGGEKAPRALASFFFPEGCGKAFFEACYAKSATKVEPCASYKGNAKCALSDFDAIYLGKNSQLG